MSNNLKNDVREDLKRFVDSCRSAVSEEDFKWQLRDYLKSTHKYDYVDCECQERSSDLPGYEWSAESSVVRTDVRVLRARKIVIIELKYVTKRHQGPPKRSYNFWKDVRRLECMQRYFGSDMEGGFAVFVTNNPIYEKGPQREPNYIYFTMAANDPNAGPDKHWADMTTQMAKENPNFSVDRNHCKVREWNNSGIAGFRYCMIEI